MTTPKPKAKRSFRVRPTSREPGQARVRGLACFSEVYDRILDGWPISEVARFVQETKKELTDLTRAGAMATLQDFRQTIPPAELTKRRLLPAYAAAAREVEEGLDELVELEKLYKLQMKRIAIDAKNEENIKKLLPTTGQEVRIAREILSTYADLKMDLGLSKRHLGHMDIDTRVLADVAVRYNKPEVQDVLNDPQSRKKVLSLVERLVSKSAVALIQEQLAAPPPVVIDVPVDAVDASTEPALEGNLLGEDDDPDPLTDPILVDAEEVEESDS